jgi:hypothetical protein
MTATSSTVHALWTPGNTLLQCTRNQFLHSARAHTTLQLSKWNLRGTLYEKGSRIIPLQVSYTDQALVVLLV